MRKLVVFNLVTLDGYFAGPDGEIDWHDPDVGFDSFNAVDMIVFGRVTYELMSSYWPTPDAIADYPEVAERMNNLPKLVFSRTLESVEWNNSRLAMGDIGEEISDLKQQSGKDMVIFGSGSLVASLTRLGLIDKYQLIVHPVVLGRGKPHFPPLEDALNLRLLETRAFGSGNVLLRYEPM
ncbi:MAG: dihydrofolate reductase family protein [Chloroflexi bacterium]|nr:dihydrofolate reductase family protein [Chloroflexota bacterium]